METKRKKIVNWHQKMKKLWKPKKKIVILHKKWKITLVKTEWKKIVVLHIKIKNYIFSNFWFK